MHKRFGLYSEEMSLALLLWLCSLPVVGLIVLPLFGLAAAGFTALVLLVVVLAACWLMCGWKITKG